MKTYAASVRNMLGQWAATTTCVIEVVYVTMDRLCFGHFNNYFSFSHFYGQRLFKCFKAKTVQTIRAKVGVVAPGD